MTSWSRPGSPPSPADLVDLAAAVARRAADLLLGGLARARATAETKSTRTDMVSELDRASEQLVVSSLLGERPADGILGEEGSAVEGTSGVRWVVDPLDGTTNYLYGLPGWAVSIAAEDGDGVVAGVVWDPVHGELFSATRGGGARLDGRPVTCSSSTDLSTALLATGFGYDRTRRRAQAEVLVEVLPRVRDIRRLGSAAIDLCAVACGRVDGYYERGLEWWDLAAGSLIAAEAGAVVTGLPDGASPAGSVVAAAPGIATPLRELLGSVGADGVP